MKAIWNNKIIAESNNAKRVEGNYYFPPMSVKMKYLKKGDGKHTCPWKGETTYYNIAVDNKVNENAAWSFLMPREAAKYIREYMAFDVNKDVKVM